MRDFWYRFGQWTWGIFQTLLGSAIFLIFRGFPHENYMGSVMTRWPLRAGLSLGMFIFVPQMGSEDLTRLVCVHEYGHTIQSLLLGPLYLFVIGLPSLFWANFPPMEKLRRTKGISYYRFYPERWANFAGGKKTHLLKEMKRLR